MTRTDTERLEWLIHRIRVAEAAILETIEDFELAGHFAEAKGANDSLDAFRLEFPVWISELSANKIDEGMEIENSLIEIIDAEERG